MADTPPTQLSGTSRRLQIVRLLLGLKAIGDGGAWTLTHEFFGWRKFSRGKSVGAAAGLIPGEFASGNMDRELSITKAGNRRVRRLMTQLAWLWIRYQPETEISRWFVENFASGPSKRRRVGIVAASRKLLVALWRYVEHGVVIEGAVYKDCALAA